MPLSVLTDPVEIVDHLDVRCQRFEKLQFPPTASSIAMEPVRWPSLVEGSVLWASDMNCNWSLEASSNDQAYCQILFHVFIRKCGPIPMPTTLQQSSAYVISSIWWRHLSNMDKCSCTITSDLLTVGSWTFDILDWTLFRKNHHTCSS